MQDEKFIEYLKSRNKQETIIEKQVGFVKEIDDYLINEKKSLGIDKSYLKDLQAFLKQWDVDKSIKSEFLLAMKNYSKATDNTNMIANVNRLLGRGTWLSRLEETLNEYVGEELQQQIMEAGRPIKHTSTPAKKAVWAKCMMECLEANVDEKTCKEILNNNLHFKSPKSPSFKKLKRMYEKSGNIDVVLQYLHDKWKKIIGDRYGYDSSEYKYVEADPTIEAGIREGNIVYVSKIPFKIKQFIESKNEQTKRYQYCHCAWVRDSITKSEEDQVSHTFCNCSGGWHKVPFEAIFDQTLEVDLVKSVLKGDDICTFAIHLPKEVIKKE